jgi:hypothetical protein
VCVPWIQSYSTRRVAKGPYRRQRNLSVYHCHKLIFATGVGERHREQHYLVAAQIRGRMPRFLNMPDSEILVMPKNSRSAEGAAEDVIEIVRTYLK